MSNGGFSNSGGGGYNRYGGNWVGGSPGFNFRPPMASGFNGGGLTRGPQSFDGTGWNNGGGGNWAGGNMPGKPFGGMNSSPSMDGWGMTGSFVDRGWGPGVFAPPGTQPGQYPGNMGGNVQPNDGPGQGLTYGAPFSGQNAPGDMYRRQRMGMVQSAISPQPGNDPQAGMGGIGGLFSPGYSLRGY